MKVIIETSSPTRSKMFNGGKSSIAAAFLAILASLHFMEVDPQQWKAEESAVFIQPSHFLFQYLTDPINVPEYLTLVAKVKENRASQKLVIGKGYSVSVPFPLVGQKNIPMRVIAMKSNAFVTLKGGQDFFLQPVFNLQVTSTKDDRRKVTLQIHFDHKSMLFQYTLGSFLRFLMEQHFQSALFSLRWIMPQDPDDLNGAST